MAENVILVRAPLRDVRRVLADPLRYSNWVVGAKHIRRADAAWPEPGSRFSHTVGIGPFFVNDYTEVRSVVAGRWELDARAWPAGRAAITLQLDDHPEGTRVTMREVPSGGPAVLLPRAVNDAALRARNRIALRRLAATAEQLSARGASAADGEVSA